MDTQQKAQEMVTSFLNFIKKISISDLSNRAELRQDNSTRFSVDERTSDEHYSKIHFHFVNSHESKPKVEVFVNIPQEYIDTVALDDILRSVDEFMEASGFEYEAQEEPIYGSFFQKLLFLAKRPKTQEQVGDALEKGKAALQAHYLNKPVAESTAQLSTAAAGLITACNGVDEIVIRAGVLILVKTIVNGSTKMMVETISPQLMNYLDENPGMLRDPALVYHFLAQLPEQFRRAKGNHIEAYSAARYITYGEESTTTLPGSDTSYALGA